MTGRGTAIVCAAAMVVIAVPCPADAAVRQCQRVVTSGPHVAATELAARQAALAAWSTAAAVYGPTFTGWRIAASRSFGCARIDGGQTRCEAIAMPCTIRHVPSPDFVPGTPPAGPPAPKSKGLSI